MISLQIKFHLLSLEEKSFTPLIFKNYPLTNFISLKLLFKERARTHQQQTMRRELLRLNTFLNTETYEALIIKHLIPLLYFAAMESTVALIWANISLSLFAKPQLSFTTKFWSRLVLTAGLMLEFCRLAVRKGGQYYNTEEQCETQSRKHLCMMAQRYSSKFCFKTMINRQPLTRNDTCKRAEAEIKLFTKTRSFSGLVSMRRKS